MCSGTMSFKKEPMTKNRFTYLFFLCTLALLSCSRNQSRFFGDSEEDGLSIFSDRGYNVMSYYVNGVPFRTEDRTSGGIMRGLTSYEVYLDMSPAVATDNDTLFIRWTGSLSLVLMLPRDFEDADFNSFAEERVLLDGNNGYFLYDGQQLTGYIYFRRASLKREDDRSGGNISGLFEAGNASMHITRGRFDHWFSGGVNAYDGNIRF